MGACKTISIAKRALIALFAVCIMAGAVYAKDVKTVTILCNDAVPYQEVFAGFQRYLSRQRAKVNYHTYVLDDAALKPMQVMQQLKEEKADLIFAVGNKAADAVMDNVTDTPIVVSMILKNKKLMNTRNAMGVILEFPVETEFSFLRRIVPEVRRIGVIYNPKENEEKIVIAEGVAKKMGLILYAREVNNPKDLPNALKNIAKNSDVLWGIPDSMVFNAQTAKQILLFSFRNNIPFCGLSPSWVEAGALYSLGWDYTDIGMQGGEITWKMLQGNEPKSAPIVSPRTARYFLNLRTARHMKIKISEEIIDHAHQVFKE
ncbi:MAG: hypothetical protein DCC43_07005 [Candidatus Brocadia sp.]|nr:hypothetical protein [Candidatus Brocadia fulgida]MCC6324289.1 hypothetical protein [Candidatus Brocadia sp.]MCE7911813.1 hypothetical protein [Candidatus Brocadia sp. AMX3]MDG5997637.1 hypothetical protein [Candidatus Brocadia sp.]RIK00645.1 MAG: hypothetical protein DCC43_07005 [Candidatus Brocadia sp.]